MTDRKAINMAKRKKRHARSQNKNTGKAPNFTGPSKKLKLRTAADWKQIITKRVSESSIPKIAILVWWDYIDTAGGHLKMSPWFRDQLDKYNHKLHDLKKDELCSGLIAVGYSKKNAKAKRPASDAVCARAEQEEMKQEQRRLAQYEYQNAQQ